MKPERLQRLVLLVLTIDTVVLVTLWPPSWIVIVTLITTLLAPFFFLAYVDHRQSLRYARECRVRSMAVHPSREEARALRSISSPPHNVPRPVRGKSA